MTCLGRRRRSCPSNRIRSATAGSAFLLILAVATTFAEELAPRIVGAGPYHLGTEGLPEWQEFEGKTPHARRLDLKFEAQPNAAEQTLFIRQYDVKLTWNVLLNGKKIGQLPGMDGWQVNAFAVPANTLKAGENTLAVVAPPANEDIIVGAITLDPRPRNQALSRATLLIVATENGGPVPCRITLADKHGALLPFVAKPHTGGGGVPETLVTRTGVVYTRDGRADLGVPPGEYVVYATRGFEYNMATAEVTIAAGENKPVALQLVREVPTPNLVAADTHIHTLTHSGHGDATLAERMLTIAGEGIELPIATDHNHHANYSDAQIQSRVTRFFTPVPGNEVTTKAGHFNIFPIAPGSTAADHKIEAWPELFKAMRQTPGVQVITLNHPRDLHSNFIPLGPKNFNAATGMHVRGPELAFDAIETITSGALQSDIMLLYHDWFALLNHGYRVSAIASSDTHDVSRFILGQGRTYVRCKDIDPAAIDIAEACRGFRGMRVCASLGLLTQLSIDDKFSMGDLATNPGTTVNVTVTVLGPSWINADKVEVFANGVRIVDRKIEPTRSVEKFKAAIAVPKPQHDLVFAAIATGPGVTAPCWALPRPYQPSSKVFNPRVCGSSGPVWLDGDGDGKFTPAREYAQKLILQHAEFTALLKALGDFDEAVACQAASLLHVSGQDLKGAAAQASLKTAAPHVQAGVARYLQTVVEEKK